MRFAVLTGGGDSPAINAATRAIVLSAIEEGHDVIGIRDGWRGAVGGKTFKLTTNEVSGILNQSGTILGTSRTNPFKMDKGVDKVLATFAKQKVDYLIAIGGDDTLGVTHKLAKRGVKAIGIPQTIDNDLGETDYAIGFDTSLNFVMDALDRLRSTAASHSRVIVAEIMGRDAGWLALLGGLAGGADVILIPERKFDMDHVCETIKAAHKKGKRFAIVAVAEGALPEGGQDQVSKTAEKDGFGHVILGGISEWIAAEMKKRTDYEVRSVILGHMQRGGTPTAFDRNLATRYGAAAVMGCLEGKTDTMVALKGHNIVYVPLDKALKKNRVVDLTTLKETEFFLQVAMRDHRSF